MSIRTKAVDQIVRQCGDNLWGSCSQYPVSHWKSEIEAGNSILGYWEWVYMEAEADGVPHESLTPEGGQAAIIDQVALSRAWTDVEKQHARESIGVSYGPECIVALANGREIRTPPFPGLCSYVRIVDQGFELAFWEHEEFTDDASDVLGALMGAAKGIATN